MDCLFKKVDPAFDAGLRSWYRLSVLLGNNGFGYAVTDRNKEKVMAMAAYSIPAKAFQNTEALASLLSITDLAGYADVHISIANPKFTLVPDSFIAEKQRREVLSLLHELTAYEKVISEIVFEKGPCVLQALPQQVYETCEKAFRQPILHSAALVWIKGIMRAYSRIIARQIFINFYTDYFELAVIQGSRLLYLNAFNYSAATDVLYYVVFVLEQLGFSPAEEEIILTGMIDNNAEIVSLLKTYCARVSFADFPKGLSLPIEMADMQAHAYFTLLNIALCV